jgi:hypothetical protein
MAVYKKTKSTPKRKPAKQGITYGEPNPEGPPPPKPAAQENAQHRGYQTRQRAVTRSLEQRGSQRKSASV